MKITKKVQGKDIILDLIKIKKYPNNYTLYGVYRDNKCLYKTCFTSLQLKELKKQKFLITEEDMKICI